KSGVGGRGRARDDVVLAALVQCQGCWEVARKGPYLPGNPDRIGLPVEDEAVEAAARRRPRVGAGGFLAESREHLASDSIRMTQNYLLSVAGNFATQA